MKIANAQHLLNPWRVHTLAADFELLDVWEVDAPLALASEPDRFDRFYSVVSANGLTSDSAIVTALFNLRAWMGRVFGWDREQVLRPIPGCTETSVTDRLSSEDISRSLLPPGSTQRTAIDDLRVIYKFEDEALLEISNATIHAMVHFSWAPGESSQPRLAVYIKSRGLMSRVYMALIEPFRELFVYPAWMKHIAAKLTFVDLPNVSASRSRG